MKIACVCACTSGIAHTYIAREKLKTAAAELGYTINIETQGTIGTENKLSDKMIAEADVVLLAIDIAITGKERFKGKKVVTVPTTYCVKSPKKLLETIHAKVKDETGENNE